jgi:uncharacterized protein (DUF2062 family)
MTPTVGVQTVFILVTVILTRRFFYFNAPAAMAATYVSNPVTMVPLYYFWYRLGAVLTGGDATMDDLRGLWEVDGFAAWLEAVGNAGEEIGVPMLVGALISAVICSAIAYPTFYYLLTWIQRSRNNNSVSGQPLRTGPYESQQSATPQEELDSGNEDKQNPPCEQQHTVTV